MIQFEPVRPRLPGWTWLVVLALAGVVVAALGSRPATADSAAPSADGDNMLYLPFVNQRAGLCYRETGGIVIGEIEHQPVVDEWVVERDIPGFTGDSYYTWRGPNQHTSQSLGVLSYTFIIESPGLYRFRLRNYHGHPDPTEENDVWVSIDGAGWVKSFSPDNRQWNYYTWYDYGHGLPQEADPRYYFGAGTHELRLAARSRGFSIDRFVFYLIGTNGEDPDLPHSPFCY